jgi:hypothetical protein
MYINWVALQSPKYVFLVSIALKNIISAKIALLRMTKYKMLIIVFLPNFMMH